MTGMPRRPLAGRKLRVGLTSIGGGELLDAALWASGMAQNVAYLAMLLARLPDVEPILVVPDGTAGTRPLHGVPVAPAGDALDRLDCLIEIGIRLDPVQMKAFRARGGRLVSYMAGNAMVMNLESVANANAYGEILGDVGYDAAWLTPQHVHTNRAYVAITRSENVWEAPHIWHPVNLVNAISQFGSHEFFWKPREADKPWRIGVFDPTVNVVKTFHLPLFVCEEAARIRPGFVERVLLFSANRFIGNPHFAELVGALDLGREGRVFAEDRHNLPAVLGPHVDAVVTHQWENGLNYLYWDVLYAGRPLVHNAPAIRDVGYWYRDFDPKDGGRALLEAFDGHAATRGQARAGELETLWTFSIDNPAVQERYAHLIAEALEARR